ncbi:haloacid dehalogenase type II [Chromobacterium sp. IIBBL 290-4]|uniref:haloacid dehalogenase type II n=1 Tax=Chromobacterium sp. IIBBL 290-4 TaxID=2953890 RepID=UPI0020B892E5|nr:haloacid dehalogenase type II [Chromobacterium sp. IIBBL 290-4]UTH75248.1 haloacid dehalogenase type II [Chromobacterium sp. IIBBL 290-4]
MRTGPVDALVFDVFGTVVDWREGVARDAAAFLSRRGLPADGHAFADAWRARYSPAMEAVRSGSRPFARLDQLHLENLRAILPDFDIDPASAPEDELQWLNRAWHRLEPWPDSLAGLSQLKRRYIIAPLSNGNFSLLLNLAKYAGLPWDAIMGAELAQAYKPTPQAYQRTAALLDLPPERVCLVAAHNGDLAAARRSGYKTAFIHRPREHGPDQKSDLVPEQDWDWVAGDLVGLAGMLGA